MNTNLRNEFGSCHWCPSIYSAASAGRLSYVWYRYWDSLVRLVTELLARCLTNRVRFQTERISSAILPF